MSYSSTLTLTKKSNVYMSHICSSCGFPVITVVEVVAEAQQTYTFSRTEAEKSVNQMAENSIVSSMHDIEACKHSLSVVSGKKKRAISGGGYCCYSSFNGYISPCSHCLNYEPWISPNSPIPMSQLKPENFPTVYKTAQAAEKWAYEYLDKMMKEIEEKRADETVVESATQNAFASVDRVSSINKELESIKELGDKKILEKQLGELELQNSKVGILDLKNKIDINSKIKDTKLKLSYINKVINDKTAPLNSKLIAEKLFLKNSQALAFGCTGKVKIAKSGLTYCYFPETKIMPDDLMERIKNFDKDKNSGAESAEKQKEKQTASPDAAIFCSNCGFKLITGSVFCTKCGAKVE